MKKMKRIWTLLLTAVLLVSLLPFRAAASEEEFPKVLAQAKKGVVQIYGLADDGFFLSSWVGTGFAVGEEGKDSDIFLTNWHVVANNGETPNAEIKLWILQENCPIDDRTLEPDPSLSITCKVLKTTTGYPDYAIIQATEPISGYEALPLLPSEEVLDGTKVYALGYPAVVGDASASHYGIDDITSTDGIVSQHMQYALADNTWVLMHTAKISGGNSGGPLITQKGAVVGLNTYGFGEYEENMDRYCAVYVDYAIEGLEELGLTYTLFDEGTVQKEEPEETEEDKKEEKKDDKKDDKKDEEKSEEDGDKDTEEEEESNLIPILAIAAVAAVAVVVLLIAMKKKKEREQEEARRRAEAERQRREAEQRRMEQQRREEEQRRLEEEQYRREEEQRRQAAAVKAKLRLNGGSTYPVRAAGGIIGRETDCMIVLPENAPGVSRHHCSLEFRGDQLVLRDLNSTYGTFIHGKRLPPNTPIALKPGASFSLGSDKVTFTVC